MVYMTGVKVSGLYVLAPYLLEEDNMQNHIKFLLNYCQDEAGLYNRVARKLWVEFGIRSAELNLLCTFICAEMLRDRRFVNEYTTRNIKSDKRLGEGKKRKRNNTGRNVENVRGESVEHSQF